ncbi:hypothetical protein [Candidatus Ichthyocystis sparus]|uniref:hypothetical protein n=1 Tax=Candidatus Ichthyocystis sparus TaxID=1561004 RepID=UPI000AB015B2|nr:hypothetical protein [Candidatus Ichthyocystis sparus]
MNPVTGVGGDDPDSVDGDSTGQGEGGVLQQAQALTGGVLGVVTPATVSTAAATPTTLTTPATSTTLTTATTSVGKGSSGTRSRKGKERVPRGSAAVSRPAMRATVPALAPNPPPPPAPTRTNIPLEGVGIVSFQTMEYCGFCVYVPDLLALSDMESNFLRAVGEVAVSIFRPRLRALFSSHGVLGESEVSVLRDELLAVAEADAESLFRQVYLIRVYCKVVSSLHLAAGERRRFSAEEAERFKGSFFVNAMVKARECLALAWNAEVSMASQGLGGIPPIATTATTTSVTSGGTTTTTTSVSSSRVTVATTLIPSTRSSTTTSVSSGRTTATTTSLTSRGSVSAASSRRVPGFVGPVDLFGFQVFAEFSEMVNSLISEIHALARRVFPQMVRAPMTDAMYKLFGYERRAWCTSNVTLYETGLVARCFAAYCSKFRPDFINALSSVEEWDSASGSLSPLTGDRLRDFWLSLDRAVIEAIKSVFAVEWDASIRRFFFALSESESGVALTELCGEDFVKAHSKAGVPALAISGSGAIAGRAGGRVVVPRATEVPVRSSSVAGGSSSVAGVVSAPQQLRSQVASGTSKQPEKRVRKDSGDAPITSREGSDGGDSTGHSYLSMLSGFVSSIGLPTSDVSGAVAVSAVSSSVTASVVQPEPGAVQPASLLSVGEGFSTETTAVQESDAATGGGVSPVGDLSTTDVFVALPSEPVILGGGIDDLHSLLLASGIVPEVTEESGGEDVMYVDDHSSLPGGILGGRSSSSEEEEVSIVNVTTTTTTTTTSSSSSSSSEVPPLFVMGGEIELSMVGVVASEVSVVTEGDDVISIDDSSSASDGEQGDGPSSSEEEVLVIDIPTPSTSTSEPPVLVMEEVELSVGTTSTALDSPEPPVLVMEEVELSVGTASPALDSPEPPSLVREEVVLPMVVGAVALGALEDESSGRAVVPTTSASSVSVEVGVSTTTVARGGGYAPPKRLFKSRYSADMASSSRMASSSSIASSSVLSGSGVSAAGPLSSVPVVTGGVSPLVVTTVTTGTGTGTGTGEGYDIDIGERLAAWMNRGLPPSPPPASESAPTEGGASSSRGSGRGRRKRKRRS